MNRLKPTAYLFTFLFCLCLAAYTSFYGHREWYYNNGGYLGFTENQEPKADSQEKDIEKILKSHYKVGFTIIEFPYKDILGKERNLITAVWYPSEGEEKEYEYGGGYARGKVVFDGKAAYFSAPFPLIVYSHGYGGGGIASVFLTEYLASLGFVVASPDYDDDEQAVRIRGEGASGKIDILLGAFKLLQEGSDGTLDRKKYSYRPCGLKAVIDKMLQLSATEKDRFSGAIDRERIGVVGHSFGSYTSLAVSGANASDKDTRIKAVVSLSGGLFFKPEEFKNISIPVMYMFGEAEAKRTLVRDIQKETRTAYENSNPPKYFLQVKKATHFTFCERVRTENDAKTAAEQIRVINTYTTTFFLKYVNGNSSVEEVLKKGDAWLTKYEVVLEKPKEKEPDRSQNPERR